MRKTLILSWLALLLLLGLPWLPLRLADAAAGPGAPAAEQSPPQAADGPEAPPEPIARAARPAPETLVVLTPEGEREMPLEDYLVGVVAAEMPASFEPEALKAQAVAARSYALCQAAGGKHGAAQVCTDYRCCQAWLSEEELQSRWGEDGEELGRIRAAVEATAGEYLSYEGEPALAVFHASSAGATEDSGAIWNSRPYLVSVESPETAADVPGYVSYVQCTALDLRDTILSAHPEADFSGAAEDWLGELRRDGSGRVESVELGGVKIAGEELRGLFSLRSTAFTLECLEGAFRFTVTGHGHGVGMSQYGAQVMALRGADYREILRHYYPGTALVA